LAPFRIVRFISLSRVPSLFAAVRTMYNTLFSVALFAATAVSSVIADLYIDTPKFTECQPATISWGRTKGPYHVYIVDALEPCGDVLYDFGKITHTSITWSVGLPANSSVELYVQDAEYDEAWSGSIRVSSSNNRTCVPKSLLGHFNVSNPSKPPGTSTHLSASPTSTNLNYTPANTTSTVPSTSHSTSPTTSPTPVGAANAGTNPFKNGAPSMRHVCTPLATIGAFLAAVALAL